MKHVRPFYFFVVGKDRMQNVVFAA